MDLYSTAQLLSSDSYISVYNSVWLLRNVSCVLESDHHLETFLFPSLSFWRFASSPAACLFFSHADIALGPQQAVRCAVHCLHHVSLWIPVNFFFGKLSVGYGRGTVNCTHTYRGK